MVVAAEAVATHDQRMTNSTRLHPCTVDPPMGSTAMRGRNARLCKSLQLITQHGYNVGTFRIRIGGHLVAFLWVNSPFEVAKMKK